MKIITTYDSPLGTLYLSSDGKNLTGLSFKKIEGLKLTENTNILFKETIDWLNIYFKGYIPNFTPKYKLENLTEFRRKVIEELIKIPYGKTVTYKEIASSIAKSHNIKKMAAQAIGGAVGKNPICIIIPCHRVIGISGNLTGYSGGIENKKKLLEMERLNNGEQNKM